MLGGLVISPHITLSVDEVDPARAGAGGGLLQTAQRVGSALGMAVVLADLVRRVRSPGASVTPARPGRAPGPDPARG